MRRSLAALACLVAAASSAACSANPPARWAEGGAPVDLPRARWVRGDVTVDVLPDGKVLVNGEPELSIDRAGRVYDLDAEPVALLEHDGRVVGPDDASLGMVGSMHASLPGEVTAWISVMPSGEVVRYDDEGERYAFGIWSGCARSPSTQQVCTLVTHLLGMRLRNVERQHGGGPGVSIGIGVGVGVPIR